MAIGRTNAGGGGADNVFSASVIPTSVSTTLTVPDVPFEPVKLYICGMQISYNQALTICSSSSIAAVISFIMKEDGSVKMCWGGRSGWNTPNPASTSVKPTVSWSNNTLSVYSGYGSYYFHNLMEYQVFCYKE